MRKYVIYDRETGDVLATHVSPGPMELADEVIEELVASGRLERAAFTEVDPGTVPMPKIVRPIATLAMVRPPASYQPLREAV